MKPVIFAMLLFCFVIAIIVVPIANKPEPQKPIFENETAFIESLQRYTEAYQSLTNETERQYFADAYLKIIIKHAFVLPATNNADNIQVILPEQVDGQKVAILKEIQLGPDNGLREAMYRIVYERHHYSEPPFYSEEVGELLREVVGESGNDRSVAN